MPEAEAAWRRNNAGHLLFIANARFMRDKLDHVHTHGFPDLGNAVLTLLLNVDPAGTRPGTIAARMGLGKSSVAELLRRAERTHLLVRASDPADSRAALMRLTDQGEAALEAAKAAIAAAQSRFIASTGAPFADAFRRQIGSYAADLAGSIGRPEQWHQENIGRVLSLGARRFVTEVLAIVHQRGHCDIGEAQLGLIRHLDMAGTRLTEVADRAGMTKQSMRELVDRCQDLGLVERAADETDSRAKIIRFTPLGLSMLEDMRRGVLQAEERLMQRIGKDLLGQMRHALPAYAQAERVTPAP